MKAAKMKVTESIDKLIIGLMSYDLNIEKRYISGKLTEGDFKKFSKALAILSGMDLYMK